MGAGASAADQDPVSGGGSGHPNSAALPLSTTHRPAITATQTPTLTLTAHAALTVGQEHEAAKKVGANVSSWMCLRLRLWLRLWFWL